MTDRELIELAAKAAGIDGIATQPFEGLYLSGNGTWNPLESDADAFRLAVKLGIDVRIPNSRNQVYVAVGERGDDVYVLEKVGDDPYAATRRAITRAAAEIGKEMSK